MKWENPPNQIHKGPANLVLWLKEAKALRENQGEWGCITQFPNKNRRPAYSLAHNINAGKLKAFAPAGAFKAVARQDGDVTKVYARFVGTSTEGE